jgi:hypothetical protein
MREPRQLNVQQQNARTLKAIRSEAEYWRAHAVPEPLRLSALQKNINFETSIVLRLDINFPGMPNLWGVLLTHEERFIEFEIDSTEDQVKVYEWKDITETQNLRKHNRGIGAGYGALAIEVLHALNS